MPDPNLSLCSCIYSYFALDASAKLAIFVIVTFGVHRWDLYRYALCEQFTRFSVSGLLYNYLCHENLATAFVACRENVFAIFHVERLVSLVFGNLLHFHGRYATTLKLPPELAV